MFQYDEPQSRPGGPIDGAVILHALAVVTTAMGFLYDHMKGESATEEDVAAAWDAMREEQRTKTREALLNVSLINLIIVSIERESDAALEQAMKIISEKLDGDHKEGSA